MTAEPTSALHYADPAGPTARGAARRTIAAGKAPAPPTELLSFREQMIAMNQALLLGSLRQHELTASAEVANVRLQAEIREREHAEQALHLAQGQLRDHAGQLEELVTQRTTELRAANKRLETSIDSTKKGKEEYRLLFMEARSMQGRLSLMTRRILVTQEEERKRISRELHDDLLQTLACINLDLAILSKGLSGDPRTLQERIAGTRQSVMNAVTEVHRFARELRPAELDDLGLIPALRAYAKQLIRQKRIKVHFSASRRMEALGETERGILFRVAQEALTNVIRHACATRIKVNIAKIIGGVQLKISDNGKSFRAESYFLAKNPKRLGLVGMKERVEMIGGSLAIESESGKGTTVRAKIPTMQT